MHITPALAIDGPLDYSKSVLAKIYQTDITQLSEELFNCEADGPSQSLKYVHQDRAQEKGWLDSIRKVCYRCRWTDVSREENFIANYGKATLEDIVVSELQFIEENLVRTRTCHTSVG